MYCSTYFTYKDVPEEDLASKAVVVIDTLRFTTTLTTALQNGAKFVLPVQTVQQAFEKKRLMSGVVLGGERNTVKVPGFDAGNSPLEYGSELVQGRGVVMTTTNGTQAVAACKGAKVLLAACLNNAAAVAEQLLQTGLDVVLVCSGTAMHPSAEDTITAGAVSHAMGVKNFKQADDGTLMALRLYNMARGNVDRFLCDTTHYNNMVRHGTALDIPFCLGVDCTTYVPVWQVDRFV